jgi:hypothetical protein
VSASRLANSSVDVGSLSDEEEEAL